MIDFIHYTILLQSFAAADDSCPSRPSSGSSMWLMLIFACDFTTGMTRAYVKSSTTYLAQLTKLGLEAILLIVSPSPINS